MISYGRAPTFLMATGYEQVPSIAAYLAGDLEAARRVELDLPETAVCSSNRVLPGEPACCTPMTPQEVCCAAKPSLAEDAPCCDIVAEERVAAVEPAE